MEFDKFGLNTFNDLLACYDPKKGYSLPTKTQRFFNFLEYVKAGLIVAGGLTILNGGRDLGKTTGTFYNWLLNFGDSNHQVFFTRNSDKEIKAFAKTFNAQFGNEFRFVGETIWKMKPEIWVNKKTKEEETRYVKDQCVGFAGALGGIDGWRSANFENVKFVFVDEYNQIGNSLNAEKFLTLWTSILRTKSNVFTVIIGNRDDVAADLLIELGVRINIDNELKGDYVIPLLPNDPYFKDKCWFIDLDDNRFENNAVPTVWKAIGRKTSIMGNYYDRGYKSYENLDCIKLDQEQLTLVDWIDDVMISFGGVNQHQLRFLLGDLNGVLIVHYVDQESEYETNVKWGDLISYKKHLGRTLIRPSYFYKKINHHIGDSSILYTSLTIKQVFNVWFNRIILDYQRDKDTIMLG